MTSISAALHMAPASREPEERAVSASASGRGSKVPQVTLAFWIVKILATTLGETGGDAVSMTLGLGYAAATLVFFAFFIVSVAMQIRSPAFHPWLYWTVIIATTTAGTTLADFADRSLGIGYVGGSLLLLALVVIVLAAWHVAIGSISVKRIVSPRVEAFYWAAILASNTLGTALGDFLANAGPGFEGGALIFGAALAVIAALYLLTDVSRTLLFWAAFILTRPLGATVGDLLTKSHAEGGLELGRISSSLVLLVVIGALLVLLPSRPGDHGGRRAS